MEEEKQRYSVPSKNRIRSLKQYKDMSDDEFDLVWANKSTSVDLTKEFEVRIENKIQEFSSDYDLDDLKANDRLTLRTLAQAFIQLEDLERYSYNKRIPGVQETDILLMEKINNIMSSLRRDISKMQDDLKITRKVRKGDKEESVVFAIDELKRKAKEFYRQKMSYIWCPECKMLLGTLWTLYPDEKQNKIQLVCNNKPDGENKCGNKVTVGTVELLEKRGVNIEDVPDFFK